MRMESFGDLWEGDLLHLEVYKGSLRYAERKPFDLMQSFYTAQQSTRHSPLQTLTLASTMLSTCMYLFLHYNS